MKIDFKRKNSRRIVLRLFGKKPRWRWSEMKEEVEISHPTLHSVLKDLIDEGIVRRVQGTESYPPPVYYELTEEGLNVTEPFTFAAATLLYSLGLKSTAEETESGYIFDYESSISQLEDPESKLTQIGRRKNAREFYALLKYLETGDGNWLEQVNSKLHTVLVELAGSLGLEDYIMNIEEEASEDLIAKDSDHILFWSSGKSCEWAPELAVRLRKIVESTYPQEIAEIEALWRDARSLINEKRQHQKPNW